MLAHACHAVVDKSGCGSLRKDSYMAVGVNVLLHAHLLNMPASFEDCPAYVTDSSLPSPHTLRTIKGPLVRSRPRSIIYNI